MTVSRRRVWRAAPPTLTVVWIVAIAAAISVPLLGYVTYSLEGGVRLPAVLALLSLLSLVYVWRFGLHPLLRATDTAVVVRNPFRTYRIPWEDVTLLAPGANGLLIATERAQVEAWCVQKSTYATKRGRQTRSDRIVTELLDLLDAHDPLWADSEAGLRIRRARPDESRLLARLERAASEAALAHIFPAEKYPYPEAAVAQRWRRLLRDRPTRVSILELDDAPVGFVAFSADTVLHLGVVLQQARRGLGTALLGYASAEMFGRAVQEIHLWVLSDNQTALSFYGSHGWRVTGRYRDCEFPPHPMELEMVRPNPAAPRRSRAV